MPAAGFYNQNEGRAYPFIYPSYRPEPDSSSMSAADMLDYRVVVDFGARFGPTSGFADITDLGTRRNVQVWLHQINRSGTAVSFEFRTNVWPASQYSLIFSRQLDDKPWKIEFVDALSNEELLSADSASCAPDFVWEGYLVTGDLSVLDIADGETITFQPTDWIIEPALLEGTEFVSSVTLANYGRTHAFAPCDTDNTNIPRPLHVAAACMTGPLKLREGFNCVIRQDDSANTITIGAAVGGGRGRPCEEVPLYADEEPPPQIVPSQLLSGGPTCGEIISRINGLAGPDLQIVGEGGITVIPNPANPHGLLIVHDPSQTTSCLEEA